MLEVTKHFIDLYNISNTDSHEKILEEIRKKVDSEIEKSIMSNNCLISVMFETISALLDEKRNTIAPNLEDYAEAHMYYDVLKKYHYGALLVVTYQEWSPLEFELIRNGEHFSSFNVIRTLSKNEFILLRKAIKDKEIDEEFLMYKENEDDYEYVNNLPQCRLY